MKTQNALLSCWFVGGSGVAPGLITSHHIAVTALKKRSIGHWAPAHLRVPCDVLFLQPLGRAFKIPDSLRAWHRNGVTARHSLRLCIWGPDGFPISSVRSGTVDQLSVACPEAWVRGSLELLETTSRSSQHWLEQAPWVSTSTRGPDPGPKSLSSTMPIFNKRWALLRQL